MRVVDRFFICLALLLLCNIRYSISSKLAKKTVIKNIECLINTNLCSNLYCHHTDLDDFGTNLTIKFTFKKPIYKIMCQFKTFELTGSVYKQYGMTVDIDFCKIGAGLNHPFVDIVLPGFRTGMGAKLHACPYAGNLTIENFTIAAQDLSAFSPAGKKYKTEVVFLRGKFLPFFTLKVFDEAQLV